MSFSFNFTAATKAHAKVRVTEEMAKVVANYGVEHATDMPAAIAAAHAYIDVLKDDPTKDVYVSMHGSVSYVYPAGAPVELSSAGVSISAGHTMAKTL
jgi:hypothetical protein